MSTILVIEDEQALRDNLMCLLDAENFEVFGAGNGKTGVELAKSHLPDLIICDVKMPLLDGFGVLTALRSTPATTTIPFIFLTAKVDKTDLRQGMELGADDYLTKPFSRKELLAAISVRLERQALISQQQSEKLEELRTSIALSLPIELRSPLNNVLGFSQLLVEEVDEMESQEIREMAQIIQKSGERLERLIQNFLLYAELELLATVPERIEALRNSRTSSAATVIETLAIMTAKRGNRATDLQLELQDSTVQIAKVKLEKIVTEILDNALKYSTTGTPIRIIAAPVEQNFIISVIDYGRGMTASQIAEIGAYRQFERKLYEQKGSGLGLVIVKRLAQLLGGGLTIESTPNQQTKVKIVIPI
jgi:two-component system, sensor histidine kinase and response regulator